MTEELKMRYVRQYQLDAPYPYMPRWELWERPVEEDDESEEDSGR